MVCQAHRPLASSYRLISSQLRSPQHFIVCREAEQRQNNVLHAVIKMVEAFFKLTHRCRLTGGGIKPPEGALVKSQGAERSG